MKDKGWDSYIESRGLLDDLRVLRGIELPEDRFPQPLHTVGRLALIFLRSFGRIEFPI